jgi:hypothetical protein
MQSRDTKGGHRVSLAIPESPVSKAFKRWWALPPSLPTQAVSLSGAATATALFGAKTRHSPPGPNTDILSPRNKRPLPAHPSLVQALGVMLRRARRVTLAYLRTCVTLPRRIVGRRLVRGSEMFGIWVGNAWQSMGRRPRF